MIHAFEKRRKMAGYYLPFSITRAVEDDDSSFFAGVFALVLWKFAKSFYISLCFKFGIDKS